MTKWSIQTKPVSPFKATSALCADYDVLQLFNSDKCKMINELLEYEVKFAAGW